MSFWKKFKQTVIVNRLVEEEIYAQVLRELESGLRRDGLWAKALQISRGNEQKANALYIQYRVQSIKDEAEISEAFSNKQQEVFLNEQEDSETEAEEGLWKKNLPTPKGSTRTTGGYVKCNLCGSEYWPSYDHKCK